MSKHSMRLVPSDRSLVMHDGLVHVLPLWETLEGHCFQAGCLVWALQGVRGDQAPAGLASGRVACFWRTAPANPHFLSEQGVARGSHIEVVGTSLLPRQLLVRVEHGLLETLNVMVFDTLELGA